MEMEISYKKNLLDGRKGVYANYYRRVVGIFSFL